MDVKLFEVKWSREHLWNGCILASVAHAIMVAHYPETSNEQSWDGFNYSVQNSAGARGTVTFSDQYVVAAFRNDKSSRLSSNELNTDHYFHGAALEYVELANEEALQYLLDDIHGKVEPIITTAFWGLGNSFFSRDSYPIMMENGVFLLERQIMDVEPAIKAWIQYYDMDNNQVKLLRSLYDRKRSNPSIDINLSEDEVILIGAEDEEGLEESRVSFEEIGIYF